MPHRSLSGVEVTGDVCNAYGGFGYAQPPRADPETSSGGLVHFGVTAHCGVTKVRFLAVAERQNLCRAAGYAVAASIAECIIYHRQAVYKVNGFLCACALAFAALYTAALAVLDYGRLILRTVRAVHKNAFLRSRNP